MTTQTIEMTAAATTTIQDLLRDISALPDHGIRELAEHAKRLAEDAEIAALEAKHGTTPNAETLEAFRELDEGGGEITTIEEIMAELNAGN
jgi:hypothetical protein